MKRKVYQKEFKVGDYVVLLGWDGQSLGINPTKGIVTEIMYCNAGDGHVILDNNPKTLTDFCYVDYDISHYRKLKLEKLGI